MFLVFSLLHDCLWGLGAAQYASVMYLTRRHNRTFTEDCGHERMSDYNCLS